MAFSSSFTIYMYVNFNTTSFQLLLVVLVLLNRAAYLLQYQTNLE